MILASKKTKEHLCTSYATPSNIHRPYFLWYGVNIYCGRRVGLMFSALVSRSSGPGPSPGRGLCVGQDKTRHKTLTVPLSTQVYKWAS